MELLGKFYHKQLLPDFVLEIGERQLMAYSVEKLEKIEGCFSAESQIILNSAHQLVSKLASNCVGRDH